MITNKQRERIRFDMVRRMGHLDDENLAIEIIRRGALDKREINDLRGFRPELINPRACQRMQGALFGTALANIDRQLAARVVLHGRMTREELEWLARSLKFQRGGSKKFDELVRTVERASAGEKGNVIDRRNQRG